jgi:hypothetical protein
MAMPNHPHLAAVAVVTLLAPLAAAAEDKPPKAVLPPGAVRVTPADDAAAAKEDLAKVQGVWASELRDRQGKPVGRIIKYIKGNKEMVVQEGADGQSWKPTTWISKWGAAAASASIRFTTAR